MSASRTVYRWNIQVAKHHRRQLWIEVVKVGLNLPKLAFANVIFVIISLRVSKEDTKTERIVNLNACLYKSLIRKVFILYPQHVLNARAVISQGRSTLAVCR